MKKKIRIIDIDTDILNVIQAKAEAIYKISEGMKKEITEDDIPAVNFLSKQIVNDMQKLKEALCEKLDK